MLGNLPQPRLAPAPVRQRSRRAPPCLAAKGADAGNGTQKIYVGKGKFVEDDPSKCATERSTVTCRAG